MAPLFDYINVHPPINQLHDDLLDRQCIELSVLRLDEIHPVVSGNKIFKLHYLLEDAISSAHKTIITFGGAYSNHLAATAYACKAEGLKCVGIVRGERSPALSHTLIYCIENGMRLEFVSRSSYKNINTKAYQNELSEKFGDHTLIPEGGFCKAGAKGAEGITGLFEERKFSHICCSVGTATTFAGLINGSDDATRVMGFSALKNLADIQQRLKHLGVAAGRKYLFLEDYHFGGYAKKNTELITFMNTFFKDNKIPLDFVYTGKMMFGVIDLVKKNFFPSGSNILCIHSGGLQGNGSLPNGSLNF